MRSNSPRRSYVILAAVVLSASAAVVLRRPIMRLISRATAETNDLNTESPEGSPSTPLQHPTGLQIAEKNMEFVDDMKQGEAGLYSLGMACDRHDLSKCAPFKTPIGDGKDRVDGDAYLMLLMADTYSALFNVTRSSDYKTMADADAARALDEFVGLDPNGPPAQACPMVPGIMQLIIRQYAATKYDRYLGLLKTCEGTVLKDDSGTLREHGRSVTDRPEHDDILGALTKTDMALKLYEFTHKDSIKAASERALRHALKSADQASLFNPMLYTSSGTRVFSHSCAAERSVLDVYASLQDPQWLGVADSFFTSAQIASHLDKFQDSKSLLDCADALETYARITHQDAWRAEAETVLQELALNYWDSEDFPKINGDNGLLYQRNSGVKATEDSVRSALVFSKFADQQFDTTRK